MRIQEFLHSQFKIAKCFSKRRDRTDRFSAYVRSFCVAEDGGTDELLLRGQRNRRKSSPILELLVRFSFSLVLARHLLVLRINFYRSRVLCKPFTFSCHRSKFVSSKDLCGAQRRTEAHVVNLSLRCNELSIICFSCQKQQY